MPDFYQMSSETLAEAVQRFVRENGRRPTSSEVMNGNLMGRVFEGQRFGKTFHTGPIEPLKKHVSNMRIIGDFTPLPCNECEKCNTTLSNMLVIYNYPSPTFGGQWVVVCKACWIEEGIAQSSVFSRRSPDEKFFTKTR
jgi:hypothetical protein